MGVSAVIRSLFALCLSAAPLAAQVNAPARAPQQSTREAPPAVLALPDSSGFGVPVLAVTKAPDGALWVGTYGRGIYILKGGDSTWSRLVTSDSAGAISFDFIHAFAFPRPGVIWYGAVGNGWGCRSTAGSPGRTGPDANSAPSTSTPSLTGS